MTDNLDSIPLHDRVRQAEKIVRKLAEELEIDFLPRVRELQRMIDADAIRPAGDLTVREAVRKIFVADETVDGTWQKTQQYLDSIAADLERLASE